MFCPELQRLLKPIYDLTRKDRQFIWRREQQNAFEEIKSRLVKLKACYIKYRMEKPKLIAYTS